MYPYGPVRRRTHVQWGGSAPQWSKFIGANYKKVKSNKKLTSHSAVMKKLSQLYAAFYANHHSLPGKRPSEDILRMYAAPSQYRLKSKAEKIKQRRAFFK